MRKLIVLLALTAFSLSGNAQSKVKEAEFIGNVRYLQEDSTTLNLDKSVVKVKTKASGSKMWWGVGSQKAFFEVPGKTSKCVISRMGKDYLHGYYDFIIRTSDNEIDPSSIILVFKYELKGGNRRVQLGKVHNRFGNSEYGAETLAFEGKKFGKSSYIITLQGLQAGEYGVSVRNPKLESSGDTNAIIYSFTIK